MRLPARQGDRRREAVVSAETRWQAFRRRWRKHGLLKALWWGESLDRGDRDQEGMIGS